MSNSLQTGVAGLRAHQQMLDVVGDNLANLNTTGFKDQRVRFSDLLYQTLRPATSTTATSGGTDPEQVGLGVQTAAIDSILSQGGLQTTGNPLDLALQGQGFFVVNNGTTDSYTRAGAFGVDEQNFLVDPGTGLRVQRFGTVGEGGGVNPAFQTPGDENIQIPYGTGISGQATQSVTFRGNLSANLSGPQAQVLTSAQPLLSGGVAATASTALNALDDNTVDYTATDQIQIQGTTSTGTAVNATFNLSGFTFPPGPTVGDLVNFLNSGIFPGSTASLGANGNLVLTDNTPGPSQLSLTISDGTQAGQTGATSWSNHAAAVTTTGKNGDTVNGSIQVYDPQGTSHNLSFVLQKAANNTWNLTASIPPSDGTVVNGTVNGIVFNNDGSLQGPGSPSITVQFAGMSSPQTVQLNLGSANGFDGLTQFGGSSSASATSQDGFAAGFLSSVSIAQDGVVSGVFTNGRTLPLAQLAIASFANAGGLNREGDNLFGASAQSGDPLIGAASTGGRGSVQQGALESSNVDVAQEFTNLIVAERGFQVNARTITVSDNVLQDLANIVR